MKTLSRKRGIARLDSIRDEFRTRISANYEYRAKDCQTCEVRGSCCTDEHFVNVRITRLEAEAIEKAVQDLPGAIRDRVINRSRKIVEDIRDAASADSQSYTYSCPLFDSDAGCLVHETAKPLPCINHACYENRDDLPPPSLLEEAELTVVRLNSRVYGNSWSFLPIPEWLAANSD